RTGSRRARARRPARRRPTAGQARLLVCADGAVALPQPHPPLPRGGTQALTAARDRDPRASGGAALVATGVSSAGGPAHVAAALRRRTAARTPRARRRRRPPGSRGPYPT